MRQLTPRLSLALPIAQLLFSAILEYLTPPPDLETHLPTVRQLSWGINAPALIARGLGSAISRVIPQGSLSNNTIEAFFLIGVLLTWYFVGRALDRRMAGLPMVQSRRNRLTMCGSLLVLGLFLGFEGVGEITRHVGEATFALLLGVWAIVLIAGSVSALAGMREARTVHANPL